MKPLTIPVVLAGASLTVLAIAAKATSLTLDFSRTVGNGDDTLLSSGVEVTNANNIYVVDGINNALEVLDTSVWFSPPVGSPDLNQSGIYFLDGINNTLQVLDDTSTGILQTSLGAPTRRGNAFLVDEFNKNIEIPDPNTTGLIASSGRRDGKLNLPNSVLENSADDYYIVDGFNNSLEITNRDGSVPSAPETQVSSGGAIANFFTGGSKIEDMPSEQLAFLDSSASSIEPDNGVRDPGDIDIGSEVPSEAVENSIIDSIGNPNRELGWTKNLSVNETDSVSKNLFLQRSNNSGDWTLDSAIATNSEAAEDLHLVDGLNNALQVVKTGSISPLTLGTSGVYLVEGTNNSLQVSDLGSQFSFFGSNSSSASYQASQAPLSGEATAQSNVPPDFLNFLANSNGNSSIPVGSALGELGSNSFSGSIGDRDQFSQTYINANQSEDYYQVQESNRIELVESNGEVFTVSDGEVAVDGNGNVYVLSGINNRIRIAGEGFEVGAAEVASVPEPSSVLGLVLLGGGTAAARWKRRIDNEQ